MKVLRNDNFTLINGECIEVMNKLIEKGIKVDAIITDPPYGTTACKWDSVIPFDKMWNCLNNLVKEKGAICLFGSQPFTSLLVSSNIKNFKYEWIWDKVKGCGFLNAKKMPMRQHEIISVFIGPGNKLLNYYPIMEKLEKPSRYKLYGKSDCFGEVADNTKVRTREYKYPKSIITVSNANQKGKVHPTQKPIALMEYLIKTYINEGETVLDFTMGSGSTGVACKNLNRKFIGIELDEKYFNIAIERIKGEI